MTELTLEALEARVKGMNPEQRAKLEKTVAKQLKRVWLPQPGPQREAYYHEADEVLYGGAAGGGKTDLIAGLALTAHHRSLVFRAQSTDLDGFWDRLAEVARPVLAINNTQKKIIKTTDGRVIEGGHLDLPGSEQTWQGRPHDLIAFDEAAQLHEMKVEFVMRWLRSTDPKQRKRVVFATNPPMPEIRNGQVVDTGVGDWLMRWFAPWLDERWPEPAEPGELRWCYMVAEGDRLVTKWVAGPGYYEPDTGERVEFRSIAAEEAAVNSGKVAVAGSRTFIRSLMHNNAFLKGTGYAEKMSRTPEPLRSMLLLGDFTVKAQDNPMQVIPTQWVLQANERWNDWQIDPGLKKMIMLVLFGDVAQGGADTTVLAPLFTTRQRYTRFYYGDLIAQPGADTPDGPAVAAMVLGNRKHAALIGLDGTGGWAGDTYRTLKTQHNIEAELVVSSHGCADWTPDLMYRYGNVRTKMWMDFRDALDPQSEFEIALPPNPRLKAQLTAPNRRYVKKELFIESKDDIRKRLMMSTDEADAVIGAWHLRELAQFKADNGVDRSLDIVERLNGRGYESLSQPVEMDDPLKDW